MDDFATRYVAAFYGQCLAEIRKLRPWWGETNHLAFVRCMYYLMYGSEMPALLKTETDTVPESILRTQKRPSTYKMATEAATYLLSDSGPFNGHTLRQQQLRDSGLRGGKYDFRPV